MGVGFLLAGNSHANKASDLADKISGQSGCSTGTLQADDCSALHDENQSAASARRLETASFAVAGTQQRVATIVYSPLAERQRQHEWSSEWLCYSSARSLQRSRLLAKLESPASVADSRQGKHYAYH